MTGFVGRDDTGRRVRVNLEGDRVGVMASGRVVAEGWPVVAEGVWSWPGLDVRADSVSKSTALDWREVDGERTEGGTLVADKAQASLDGEVLLFPRAARVRRGIQTLSGLTLSGEPVTWTVAGDFGGCGCGGR